MPDLDRLNYALQTCVHQCIGDRAPIARLVEFALDLREQKWCEPEVKAVEVAALRMLGSIYKTEA